MEGKTQGLGRCFPIALALAQYRAEWLRFDVIAAISVWALLVLQGIAYASIAGVPAQYGLYAALGSLVGYALFGTSGQVITGPSAAIAAAVQERCEPAGWKDGTRWSGATTRHGLLRPLLAPLAPSGAADL